MRYVWKGRLLLKTEEMTLQTKRETHRLALRNENSTTLNLTVSQFVKGLVHLVKANALDAGAKQSFAGKGQYLAEFQDAAPPAGCDFNLL